MERNFGNLKFIIFTIFSLVLVFVAVIVTIFNAYKPVVKTYINGEFIGYFSNEQQFDEVYNDLVAEKQNEDPNVKVYLESEPSFQTSYIRDTLLAQQDIYTDLREKIKSEHVIYHVAVNNQNKMNFNSQDEANKYAEYLNSKSSNLNAKVVEEKTSKLEDITTEQKAEDISKEIMGDTTASSGNVLSGSDGIWPTSAHYISSPYGWRWGTVHTGTDIAGGYNDEIWAYKDGVVTYSGWAGSYGNIIKIDHGNGISTWYAHCSKLIAKAGQKVSQGQVISLMGSTGFSTGTHLHFEVRINGVHVNSYKYIQGK